MNKKQCFKCKIWKDIELFYKHAKMADGHLGKCKSCTKKDVHNRYYDPKNIYKIKEYERKRFKDPKRKEKVLEYQKKRRITYKGKNKARQAVCRAIKSGKLIKKPCEICSDPNSQAHHEDYRKYYKVRWLCPKHHRGIHKLHKK